ncbi:MAG: DNA primase catalytic subunit PriS [Candidatus Micrarchaeota archaeon]|nr:DNA primase catalytic subunit PriS [Candidatus Micrarchaeota archaeon]
MIDVLRHFRNFYSRNAVKVDSISQREFGIGIDKKINYRHKSFSTQKEFQNFLVNETPRFISHSVGRFEFPWSQPMEKKTLLSADLIFDLDAKPEENHNYIFCTRCVEKARLDTIRLIEDFLLNDFGLSKNDLLLVFSGSKGFHVHVRSQVVQQLSSTARRLMVDYITGKELELESLVPIPSKPPRHLSGPDKTSTGWKKHFLETAVKTLDNTGLFTKKKAAYIRENKQMLVNLLENGNWDPAFHDAKEVLNQILAETIRTSAVEVDSPVTFDVHRLIRIPGTLHGDTGFIAKPLSLTEMGFFEATKHAAVFNGTAVASLKESANIEFAGTAFELKAGENVVPLSLAVLLACKGI